MDNVEDYLSSLNFSELKNYTNKTDSSITIEKNIERVVSDTSWIDMVEEAIPYLDSIIRNPRRFIVQEENIVPIEKAKVVTEESIKHLAQHTSLIQDVDEDGNIVPLKLLNVYREETFDLYENRFVKSLVDNLFRFVEDKLKQSDQKSYAKVYNKVSYTGRTKLKNEVVDIELNLNSKFDDVVDASKNGLNLEERIKNIRDVVSGFKSSTFIKSLKESSPVRSPIRKTNVILKEPNFIKALELWEYLEKNNIKPVTSIEKKHEIISDKDIKNIYDATFYVNNNSLKEKNDSKSIDISESYISKLVNDCVMQGDFTDGEFKRLINKEFNKAKKKKQKIIDEIDKEFKNFFSDIKKSEKNALSLLK